MKTRLAVVFAVVFGACWIAWGQIPISPQNRIVNGKVYNPQKSTLWINVATDVTERCARLEVASIGKISIACDVFKELLDDGGTYGVYRVIGETYVKTILIYNHPAHDAMTTGTVIYPGRSEIYNHPARDAMIYAPRSEKTGTSPTTKPFLAMRIENWRTNDVVLEAYDCGLPDTAENRKKAGIAVPTPEQLAAAQEEIAEKRRVAQQQAVEAAAAKKQAADAATLKFYQELAEKGDAYGQYRMGIRYLKGVGVSTDLDKARDYLFKAAAQGNKDAAAELAKLSAPELPAQTNSPPKQGEDR